MSCDAVISEKAANKNNLYAVIIEAGNRMKRYIAICLLFVCALSLTGCAKVVSERYEVVPAVVTDVYYTPQPSGGIEIVCKGRNEQLYGVNYYNRFYDFVGDEVWAINRIRVYDNDDIKERVINIFADKEQAERVLEAGNG